MEKLKETKEVLDFVISLGESLASSLDDGSLGVTDLINFWEPVSKLSDALDGFEKIVAEIGNLTSEDLDYLREYIKSEFDIEDNQIESLIEDGLEAAIIILKFIGKFRG
ncbi:hypothetical protein CMK18_22640 [Candidatus Poribacteria bacterium]|nr:hypothetical protein [Candidatus Poribacteria bacterium]|tara:strand:+ start:2017 stop:2343 length:327 start_codon:yes stop_codon:yes gene_type:complete